MLYDILEEPSMENAEESKTKTYQDELRASMPKKVAFRGETNIDHNSQPVSLPKDPGLEMRKEDIERFLAAGDYIQETLNLYRISLERCYTDLPADKRIFRGTLAAWQAKLKEEGYATATVNRYLSVCNTWLDFVGRREYQQKYLTDEDRSQQELTRGEYQRLLQTAKLLGYASRQGIRTGPVFITQNETPMSRGHIAAGLRRLGEEARLPEGKASAMRLNQLCRRMRSDIEANYDLLVEQAIERQLEREQLTIGWEV